jgi:hypothetical protein
MGRYKMKKSSKVGGSGGVVSEILNTIFGTVSIILESANLVIALEHSDLLNEIRRDVKNIENCCKTIVTKLELQVSIHKGELLKASESKKNEINEIIEEETGIEKGVEKTITASKIFYKYILPLTEPFIGPIKVLNNIVKEVVESIKNIKEDGQKTEETEEETDLTAADTGQLVALIQQLGEKIDLVSASFGATGVVEASLTAGVDGTSILNRLVAIDEKLNTFATQDTEAQAEAVAVKIVEKTGGAVFPEENVTKQMVAEMIGVETEKLPEQHEEMLRLLGENQSIMYSYKDQLYRLEHMIQTKAMTIDQIYRKIVKKMWDEYRCGG